MTPQATTPRSGLSRGNGIDFSRTVARSLWEKRAKRYLAAGMYMHVNGRPAAV